MVLFRGPCHPRNCSRKAGSPNGSKRWELRCFYFRIPCDLTSTCARDETSAACRGAAVSLVQLGHLEFHQLVPDLVDAFADAWEMRNGFATAARGKRRLESVRDASVRSFRLKSSSSGPKRNGSDFPQVRKPDTFRSRNIDQRLALILAAYSQ